jgi:polynucleotide 5'-kinase involved in rRNA processing
MSHLGPKNLSDRRHYLSRVYKELLEKNQKRKANLAAREIQIAPYVLKETIKLDECCTKNLERKGSSTREMGL